MKQSTGQDLTTATNPRDFVATDVYCARRMDRGTDDGTLLEGIALGDDQAMMTIYDRYSSLVFSLSWHVLRDQHSAEDVLQEVFLRLWRGAEKYDNKRGTLAAWMTVITRNLAIDHLPLRPREEQLSEIASTFHLPQDNEPNYLTNSDIVKVRSILDILPKKQRHVLELAYFGGMTGSEIAAHTGEPLGTVKSRIRLALQTMRRLLLVPSAGRSENLRNDESTERRVST